MEWCKIASKYGLDLANNRNSYDDPNYCEIINVIDKDESLSVLKWIYAVPNGGMRSVITRINLNREGVSKGYPDLGLDVPKHTWHGLRIEMKKFGGKMDDEQKKWQEFHLQQGYYSVTCYSFIEARNEILRYLS